MHGDSSPCKTVLLQQTERRGAFLRYPEGTAVSCTRFYEKYLSVYLSDFFGKAEEKESILDIKFFMEKNGFKLKTKGVFALLDVKHSKEYILQLIKEKISYKELNLPHCGIFHEYDDLVISELLSQCVKTFYIIENL